MYSMIEHISLSSVFSLIFPRQALKMTKEFRWNRSALDYDMHCAFGSLNTNQVIACIVKLGFLFFFPCMYLQIIHIWEFCGSALFSLFFSLNFFPAAPQSSLPISLTVRSWLHYLPGRLKVKEFKRSEESECEWKRSPLAFILHQNALSLALIIAQSYYEQPELKQRRTRSAPLCELVSFLLLIKRKSFLQCFL